MRSWAQTAVLAAIAFLYPAKSIILAVAALVVVDLGLGMGASLRARPGATSSKWRAIKSRGLKRTVVKLLVYETAIVLAYVAQTYLFNQELPVMSMLTTLIGLTELKSCLENLDLLYGEPFFKGLIKRLSSAASGDGK